MEGEDSRRLGGSCLKELRRPKTGRVADACCRRERAEPHGRRSRRNISREVEVPKAGHAAQVDVDVPRLHARMHDVGSSRVSSPVASQALAQLLRAAS